MKCLPVVTFLSFVFSIQLIHAVEELTVSFQDDGKTSIPSNIHPNVTRLLLRKNQITEIEADLRGLVYLEYVDMTLNPLTTIHERAFITNVNLVFIQLKQCRLTTLPVNYGGAWQWTTEIGIREQQSVFEIPPDYFVGWPKLQKLKVNYNPLPSITELNFDIPDLRVLLIQDTARKDFPNLCVAPRLEYISAVSNLFVEIPEEFITCLSNLTKLHVDVNQLSSLPDLLHLPLEIVSISQNNITCDQKLCWLRMWEYVKNSTIARSGTCDSPAEQHGMDINVVRPSKFHCYEGKGRIL